MHLYIYIVISFGGERSIVTENVSNVSVLAATCIYQRIKDSFNYLSAFSIPSICVIDPSFPFRCALIGHHKTYHISKLIHF